MGQANRSPPVRHRSLHARLLDYRTRACHEAYPQLLRRAVRRYLDTIDGKFGVPPSTTLLQLESGHADVLGDGIAPADFHRMLVDPTWKQQAVQEPPIEVDCLFLNTQIKPFDNLKVRQAVTSAINRARIMKLMGGTAILIDQLCPAGLPIGATWSNSLVARRSSASQPARRGRARRGGRGYVSLHNEVQCRAVFFRTRSCTQPIPHRVKSAVMWYSSASDCGAPTADISLRQTMSVRSVASHTRQGRTTSSLREP